jgi:hypothetical protein
MEHIFDLERRDTDIHPHKMNCWIFCETEKSKEKKENEIITFLRRYNPFFALW